MRGGRFWRVFLGLLVLMEGWSWVRVLVGRSRLVDMFRGTVGMGWGAGLVVMVVPALHFLFFTQVGDFRLWLDFSFSSFAPRSSKLHFLSFVAPPALIPLSRGSLGYVRRGCYAWFGLGTHFLKTFFSWRAGWSFLARVSPTACSQSYFKPLHGTSLATTLHPAS